MCLATVLNRSKRLLQTHAILYIQRWLEDFVTEAIQNTERHESKSGELSDREVEVADDIWEDTYPYVGNEGREHRERVLREFLDNDDVPQKRKHGREHRTAKQARLDHAWENAASRVTPTEGAVRAGALRIYDGPGEYTDITERFRNALEEIEQQLLDDES